MLESVTGGIEFREARSVAPFVEAGHAIHAFVSVRRGVDEPRPSAIAACVPAFPFPVAISVPSRWDSPAGAPVWIPSAVARDPGRAGMGHCPAHSLALSTIHHWLTPVQGIGHHDH